MCVSDRSASEAAALDEPAARTPLPAALDRAGRLGRRRLAVISGFCFRRAPGRPLRRRAGRGVRGRYARQRHRPARRRGLGGLEADHTKRSRAVRLKLEKGELKLSASSTETGESEDSLETPYNGDSLAIGFNAGYLLDFLKAVGAGDVSLELKDPQSAGQLRPLGSEDYKYRYIVMPMRI